MTTPREEIIVIQNNQPRPLAPHPWQVGLFGKTLEDALQTLIERFPQVLSGQQIDPGSEDPPRFVVLGREVTIGDWSLDLLLVDQRGVLTLVETKLLQNYDSRRKVLGQAMEYAANCFEFWGDGAARRFGAAYWSACGRDVDEVLRSDLGLGVELDGFWSTVETNLKNRKIRIVIAADCLRPEVRKTVEYLNAEMQNAEVLGLELPCFGDESDVLVLTPRLVGQTQRTAEDKTPRTPRWTAEALKGEFGGLEDQLLGNRLLSLLSMSVRNGSFGGSGSKAPGFQIAGRSVWVDGVYFSLAPAYFPEVPDRDEFGAELKAIRMLDPSLDLASVKDGRNGLRRLEELSEDEFRRLLAILSKYSAHVGPADGDARSQPEPPS